MIIKGKQITGYLLLLLVIFSAIYSGKAKGKFIYPEIAKTEFRSDTFNIIDFGAIPGVENIKKDAINKAILKCTESGGGTVLIPEGIWHTGPIIMQNNINLHISINTLVIFSKDFNDYPLIKSSYEGNTAWRCQSPISGNNLENIAFTGIGIFDGSGDVWRPVKKEKMTQRQWSDLIKSGGILDERKRIWYPTEKALNGSLNSLTANSSKDNALQVKDFLRPVMVSLIECNTILIDGPTFQNSPAWCIHPLMCENITVQNMNVRNPWYAQNGDGIDFESCRNGIITDCTFDVGDDAVCIKSGKDEEGRQRGMPTENFIVQNIIVYHGHGGFTIGSEMSGGVRNILIQNCTFLGTDIGLRFKSTRGRGGVVEDIFISDIIMKDIPTNAISFNLFYGGTSPIPDSEEMEINQNVKNQPALPEANETTPSFKNIYMNNITCNGAEQAIFIQGLPEMYVKNIVFENVKINAEKGVFLSWVENIEFYNTSFETIESEGISKIHTKNLKFRNTMVNGKKVN
ncbi:MAG: glycoside hydrolase family 28 protein [Mariniphaga sp.]|nr:glycoside hydrolase family 28 protein [Mariniphaga sp.]